MHNTRFNVLDYSVMVGFKTRSHHTGHHGQHGPIWIPMGGPYGSLWVHMGPYGPCWGPHIYIYIHIYVYKKCIYIIYIYIQFLYIYIYTPRSFYSTRKSPYTVGLISIVQGSKKQYFLYGSTQNFKAMPISMVRTLIDVRKRQKINNNKLRKST
jgi:hypothetical protein